LASKDLEVSILELLRTPGRTFPLQFISGIGVRGHDSLEKWHGGHKARVLCILRAAEIEGEVFSVTQNYIGNNKVLYTVDVTRE
jgi:hypothetical protein